MPLDSTVAPALSSSWAERLARLKRFRNQERGEQRRQRRFSKARLVEAEYLLSEIIAGADFVGSGHPVGEYGGPAVFLLIDLHPSTFERLCLRGAELEDMEESHDAEGDRHTGEVEHDECDCEPSLGGGPVYSPSVVDLEEAGYGYGAKDQAIVTAARARHRKPPEPERSGPLTYTTVDPETARAGAWVMLRRDGGAS